MPGAKGCKVNGMNTVWKLKKQQPLTTQCQTEVVSVSQKTTTSNIATINSSYNHVKSHPIKYTDPDGRFFNTLIGAVIGGLSSAGASMVNDLRTTGKVDMDKAMATGLGGAVAGAMVGLAIDTLGASAAISTLVVAGSMAGVVGGAVTDIAGGENPMDPGKIIVNAASGAASIMMGKSIDKLGEVVTGEINKPLATMIRNTNTQSVAPLEVTFKDTHGMMNTNERVVSGTTEFIKQTVDVAKDIYTSTNDE
ncbi:hypothetical protein FACS1894130_00160 [Spirochaetia bacterium]|nr:hypothetical protein FACS1894130_00160 [Spirochaetia bacterium]